MRKKIILIAGIVTAVIVVAVGVTLFFVLRHHKDESKATTSTYPPSSEPTTTFFYSTTQQGPSLDDEISLNSTFPNGSSTVDVSELGQGLPTNAPLEVNITQLNQMGITIDNSSLVAETGRTSFFYILLPPANTAREKRWVTVE